MPLKWGERSEVAITCPTCNTTFKLKPSELRRDKKVKCPHCWLGFEPARRRVSSTDDPA